MPLCTENTPRSMTSASSTPKNSSSSTATESSAMMNSICFGSPPSCSASASVFQNASQPGTNRQQPTMNSPSDSAAAQTPGTLGSDVISQYAPAHSSRSVPQTEISGARIGRFGFGVSIVSMGTSVFLTYSIPHRMRNRCKFCQNISGFAQSFTSLLHCNRGKCDII